MELNLTFFFQILNIFLTLYLIKYFILRPILDLIVAEEKFLNKEKDSFENDLKNITNLTSTINLSLKKEEENIQKLYFTSLKTFKKRNIFLKADHLNKLNLSLNTIKKHGLNNDKIILMTRDIIQKLLEL